MRLHWGRATIQCCFNLLEAFTAGLARAKVMCADDLDQKSVAELQDRRSPLRKRIMIFETAIQQQHTGEK